jgi:Protein of unknown function (DUF2786)
MNRTDAERKIRAALELARRAAKSPEGRNALRMARRLMREYGITLETTTATPAPAARAAAAARAANPRDRENPPRRREPAPNTTGSIPIRIEVKIGTARIRWKL